MNRGRLILRLALIAVAAGIFFFRGGQHNPDFMKGFIAAMALALVIVVVRAVLEAKKRKQAEQAKTVSADTNKVELFSKPKDF
jgi:hypothetical protein